MTLKLKDNNSAGWTWQEMTINVNDIRCVICNYSEKVKQYQISIFLDGCESPLTLRSLDNDLVYAKILGYWIGGCGEKIDISKDSFATAARKSQANDVYEIEIK